MGKVHPKLCLPPVLGKVNQGFQSKKEVLQQATASVWREKMSEESKVSLGVPCKGRGGARRMLYGRKPSKL